jgi:NAD(P)-dependent dehydrogenase (short-subunit alcohol dehydrogenase family)
MERVLVTGANRGIGLEYVRQLANRGDRVFAGCREPDHAEALQALAGRHPGRVVPLALDVTDAAAIDAALRAVAADGPGTLDVVINNAGVSPRGEAFSNLDATAMLDVFAVNSVAPMIVAQRARPLLALASRPRVANMSSSMGSLEKKTYGRHYSYASSKAALNMLTRAAAHDLGDEGIIVVALHPGWVRTDLGGPHAELTVEESVAGLLRVIDGLSADESSLFLTWNGERHPW